MSIHPHDAFFCEVLRRSKGCEKILLALSCGYHIKGEAKTAIALICRSLDLMDPLREPRVSLCALHNLADNLAALGRFMEAQRIQARAPTLYQRFHEPRVQGRREWVEAKIARGLGRYREAEALLIAARNEFSSIGAEAESNLVSQELAALPALGW